MFRKNSIFLGKESFQKIQILRYATAGEQLKPFSDYTSDDFQYLQKSSLPTMHFQKGLFRLPIPKLENTCERYLTALKPLLDESRFERTKNLVNDFQNNEGKELDKKLREKDANNKHTSYISKPWFEMYLKDRVPLPLNYNPAIVLNRSKHSDSESQLCKATNITVSSLRFMKSLRKGILNPEIFHINPKKTETELYNSLMRYLPSKISVAASYALKAYPLDMSQHPSLFNNTRIPKEGQDYLEHDETGRHILVIRKGHFFKLTVLDEKGNILSPEDIFTGFKHIISQDLKPNTQSVGYLTTENRDIWARARENLVCINPDNFQNIKGIDSALFVICLDDEAMNDDPYKIMKTYLHGDGMNRWFDKSFSLIISKDGVVGVNFEHSWGDGVAVLRYIKEVYSDMNKNPFTNSSTQGGSNVPLQKLVAKLDFTLDERSANDVKIAKQKFEAVCRSLGLNIVQQPELGRNMCNAAGIAPDSLMQLSFQVAFHRVYGKFVGTYESCSTSAFKHGRTETLRPCTEAVKNFTLQFNSKNRPGKEELMNSLKQCSDIHKELTKQALMGQGFDRHLFGLKHTSEELGLPLPNIYKDEAYKLINYNIISTSTLASEAILVGGFAPVVPDGLGIGYSIRSNECGSIVSSYPEKRNGKDFADALKLTFEELAALIRK